MPSTKSGAEDNGAYDEELADAEALTSLVRSCVEGVAGELRANAERGPQPPDAEERARQERQAASGDEGEADTPAWPPFCRNIGTLRLSL